MLGALAAPTSWSGWTAAYGDTAQRSWLPVAVWRAHDASVDGLVPAPDGSGLVAADRLPDFRGYQLLTPAPAPPAPARTPPRSLAGAAFGRALDRYTAWRTTALDGSPLGAHAENCDVFDAIEQGPCSCGWEELDAAMQQLGEALHGDRG